jgi:DNA excision repair protein ERCC-5
VQKLTIPDNFPDPQVYDGYFHPTVDTNTTPFTFGSPQLDALRKFMAGIAGWSFFKTDQVLIPVIKELHKRSVEGSQTRLDQFFSVVDKTSKKDLGISSKRVQKVLQDLVKSPSPSKKSSKGKSLK